MASPLAGIACSVSSEAIEAFCLRNHIRKAVIVRLDLDAAFPAGQRYRYSRGVRAWTWSWFVRANENEIGTFRDVRS